MCLGQKSLKITVLLYVDCLLGPCVKQNIHKVEEGSSVCVISFDPEIRPLLRYYSPMAAITRKSRLSALLLVEFSHGGSSSSPLIGRLPLSDLTLPYFVKKKKKVVLKRQVRGNSWI